MDIDEIRFIVICILTLIAGIVIGILIGRAEYNPMITHCESHLNGQGSCVLQAVPVITYVNQGIHK